MKRLAQLAAVATVLVTFCTTGPTEVSCHDYDVVPYGMTDTLPERICWRT